MGKRAHRGIAGVRGKRAERGVSPRILRPQITRILDAVEARWCGGKLERGLGSSEAVGDVRDSPRLGSIGRVRAGKVFREIGHGIAVEIAAFACSGEVTEVEPFPPIRQPVGVNIDIDHGLGCEHPRPEIDPANVGAPSESGEGAGEEIDPGAKGIVSRRPTEIYPACVGRPSQAGKVARTIVVHTVIGAVVGIGVPVGGHAVAEVDPANVARVGKSRKKSTSKNNPVGRRRTVVHKGDPTRIGTPGMGAHEVESRHFKRTNRNRDQDQMPEGSLQPPKCGESP